MAMWTLEQALGLVRALQEPAKAYGYHVTLGGGTLNKGESEKDLDLYFHPFGNPNLPAKNLDALVLFLEGLWGKSQAIGDYGLRVGVPPKRVDEPLYPEDGPPLGNYVDLDDPNHWINAVIRPLKRGVPIAVEVGIYQAKLKFVRPNGDRIDTFII